MTRIEFDQKIKGMFRHYKKLIERTNVKLDSMNGIIHRYQYPVLEAEHIPIFWRFDLNYKTNPNLLERLGVNCVFNSGAIALDDKIYLHAGN